MPRPRRSNLSQNSRQAIRHRNNVNQSTAEELELARERRRVSMARLRASRRQEQRDLLPETAYVSDQQTVNFRHTIANLNRAEVELERRFSCL